MTRPLRIQYPGAVYHITCRGNEKKEIFKDDTDRNTFLELLVRAAMIYNIKLFSYVLMPNHFHLLVETPHGNLGEFMRQFGVSYTGQFNRRHKRVGHLYQGRYKSILVEKQTYLSVLSRYIHLNPVKTNIMKRMATQEKANYLKKYRWSSLPGYINKKKKEEFVDYAMVLEEYGGDNDRGRTKYKTTIHTDISVIIDIKDKVIGQSILGKDEFIEWVRDEYVAKERDRECPSLKVIQHYRAKEEIIRAVEEETGINIEVIKREKGSVRQIVMDLLYIWGGLKGREIGRMMGVDYSTVTQGRKRLRGKLQNDKKLQQMVGRIERALSIVKN